MQSRPDCSDETKRRRSQLVLLFGPLGEMLARNTTHVGQIDAPVA